MVSRSDGSYLQPARTTGFVGPVLDHGTEDKGHDGGQLHDDVQGGSRGILQWVTDGVTSDGVLVGSTSLLVIRAEATSLDVLLGVVPGATGVRHRYRQLHS